MAIECAAVAALMASTVAMVHLSKSAPVPRLGLLLIFGIPCLAALILGFLATLVPSLFPEERLSFPVNFTIPVVYLSIFVLCLRLLTTMPYGLSAPVDALAPLQFWFSPIQLALCIGGQMALLTVLILFRKPLPSA